MAARNRRISKEIEDCQKQDTSNLQVEIVGDSLNHLIGAFHGPTETPYEGGLFKIDIKIPTDYPFRPPIMKFITKIYHPNISSQTGAICLDILKEQWSPVLTIKSALVSLQSMLGEPQPNDPQDAEVASHYLRDRESFNKTAAYWTRLYADAPPQPTSQQQQNSSSPTTNADGTAGATTTHRRQQGPVEEDELLKYGLDAEFVRQFTDMGFAQPRVIEVLRRLHCKKLADCAKVDGGVNKIVEEIMK